MTKMKKRIESMNTEIEMVKIWAEEEEQNG